MRIFKFRLTKLRTVLLLVAVLLLAVWVVLLGTADSSGPIYLLPIAAVVCVAVAFSKQEPKPRIMIRQNNRTVFGAAADRLCYGCRRELKPDQPKVRCSVTATHEVHAVCADVLLQGKCPQCGNALERGELGKEQAKAAPSSATPNSTDIGERSANSKDIEIRVHTQGGVSHRIQLPSDITTKVFIQELTQAISLPMRDAENHQVSWVLDDKNIGRTLSDERTLAENGVRSGHDLHLRREVVTGGGVDLSEQKDLAGGFEPLRKQERTTTSTETSQKQLSPNSKDIQVRIHTEGGEFHLVTVPPDFRTRDFIEEVTQAFKVPHVDAEDHPVSWILDDLNIGKTLSDERTLAENGVRSGHDLHLRREVLAGGIAIPQVQLSVHYPPKIVPNVWSTLLTYVHIPKALSMVQEQTDRILGRQISDGYLRTIANATRDISRGAEITVVPTLSDCIIKPEKAKFLWLEDYHCEAFRFKSIAQVGTQLLMGQVSFYVGPILICEIAVVIRLSASAGRFNLGPAETTTTTSRPYQSIFVSYAHDDSVIVQELEKAYTVLGMQYLRDIKILRSGEKWNPALLSKIDEADIFQLCWSHAAKSSEQVTREWKHAVGLNREYFLRPVYWQSPMPEPPPELASIHFALLDV
jgi:uncharacterized ubiquitin-like protein YukD